MNRKLFLTVYAITALCVIPGYTDNGTPGMSQSQNTQTLSGALYKIGGTDSDIGQLGITGSPPSSLVKSFANYANDSDNSKFSSLSDSERDSLVFFGFKLQSKGDLSDSAMKSLMVAEKMRTGMPKAHIQELMSLVEKIKANPNYELTFNDVNLINSAAPFINNDPYAFSDILGTLMGPILNATPENLPITTETEEILINAARTVTGLSQEQMDNLQNIGDNYESSKEFDSSDDNVTDVTQVIETSYYPDSANLLLPFLGAGTLIAMSGIYDTYPNNFYGEGYNEYNRNVTRNPTVENYYKGGVAPRYNDNWANNRANAANNRAQTRQNGTDARTENRGANANNRANGSQGRQNGAQARQNGGNDRFQNQGSRAGNRANGGRSSMGDRSGGGGGRAGGGGGGGRSGGGGGGRR